MRWIATLGDLREVTTVAGSKRLRRVTVGERELEFEIAPTGANSGCRELSLICEGRQKDVSIERLGEDFYRVAIAGHSVEVVVEDELSHLAHKAERKKASGSGTVAAYMPGKVVEVLVATGDTVTQGQGVVVLEAMKMQNEIQADSGGVIAKIYVEQGQAVEGGDPLFELTVTPGN